MKVVDLRYSHTKWLSEKVDDPSNFCTKFRLEGAEVQPNGNSR